MATGWYNRVEMEAKWMSGNRHTHTYAHADSTGALMIVSLDSICLCVCVDACLHVCVSFLCQ